MTEAGAVEPAHQEAAAPLRGGDRFFRWGPYGLLALSAALTAATRTELMTGGEAVAAAVLGAAALVLQLWWGRAVRTAPGPGPLGAVYYVTRTVLAGVLTLLNPFCALYAVAGYFDAARRLPERWVRAGLLTNAATMAGSQSGGLPPGAPVGWLIFAALFLLNAWMVLYFARLAQQEDENARAREDTIAELGRTNARLEQALEENAGLHAQLLLQAREAGISDERRRLAAEIHDTLAQGLTGIITQLRAASDSESHEAARSHLGLAGELARESLAQARRSVQNLAPRELEHDALPAALEKATDAWARSAGVRADFTVTGAAEPLHAEVEATLLRIAQEALTNVGRHACATRAGVTLSYMGDEVTLDVRDDGRGFDAHAVRERPGTHGGFGLGGMRARAERLAGTVEVETEPGGGTAVCARVPLVRHDD
ncbi:sensor histidine kinase [Streptomyces diacarni]|uniref:sensor histidine kinase n=1 Tax=Streptomyces diacarni TaxID=2800381 RepID=UPI0033DB6A88